MNPSNSFRKRLAQNTAAAVGANLWSIVLALGSLPLILRGLGTESFGIWILLQTFNSNTGWLSVSANGLAVASRREVATAVASTPEELHRAVGLAFAAFLVTGVFFGVILGAAGPTILDTILDLGSPSPAGIATMCAAFGIQLVGEHLCTAVTSVLEGLQEVALARGIDSVRKTAFAVAVAVVATAGGGLAGVGVAAAAATGIVTLVAFVAVRRRGGFSMGRPGQDGVRSVVRYAGTVSLLQGTGVLHRTMDRTIAGAAFGPSAVALVEIANQIQLGSTALLSATTYPMLATAPWLRARDDEPALRSLLDRLTRYSVLLTLPLVALIVVFAGPFIHLWLGPEYSEAIGLTQVAVLSVAIAAPLAAGSNLLQGTGHAGAVLRATAASVLVNLVASIGFADALGTVGVFYGTIAATIVLNPILIRSIGRHVAVSMVDLVGDALRQAAPPTLAATAVGALAIATGGPDLLVLLVGGSLALAAATFAGTRLSLGPDERAELTTLLRRSPDAAGPS